MSDFTKRRQKEGRARSVAQPDLHTVTTQKTNQREASAERGAVAGRRGGAGRDDEAKRRKKPRCPTEAKRAPQLTEGEATAVNPQGREPETSDARCTRGKNENGGPEARLKEIDELG